MSQCNIEEIFVRRWSQEEFFEAKRCWSELLKLSDADPLFSSWLWQTAWWRCFGKANDLELFIVVAENTSGELIGVAPMFRHTGYIKSLVPVKRIELIGNIFRGATTARSEYLGFVLRRDYEEEAATALIRFVLDGDWYQEVVLSDIRVDSITYRASLDFADQRGNRVRRVDRLRGFSVLLYGTFDHYISQLNASVRRQLYNKRIRLKDHGRVSIKEVTLGSLDEFFRELNRLHKIRWGRRIFSDRALEFQRTIAMELLPCRKFAGTILYVDNRPVSALLDLVAGERQYNIQAGFDTEFGKSLSIGLLHFGYAIESAFAGESASYELLVGGGKKTEYKKRLGAELVTSETLQFIRTKWLKILYRMFGRIGPAQL